MAASSVEEHHAPSGLSVVGADDPEAYDVAERGAAVLHPSQRSRIACAEPGMWARHSDMSPAGEHARTFEMLDSSLLVAYLP